MKLNYSFLLIVALIATSCSNDIKTSLGLRKQAPDEFFVISNPPLSVPPEFDLLPPEAAMQVKMNQNYNTPESLEATQKDQNATLTTEDQMFLDRLTINEPKTKVDKIVDQEAIEKQRKFNDKGAISKTLYKMRGEGEDKVIDPVKERERIRKNLKEGAPVNEGETPSKAPEPVLKRLFN